MHIHEEQEELDKSTANKITCTATIITTIQDMTRLT